MKDYDFTMYITSTIKHIILSVIFIFILYMLEFKVSSNKLSDYLFLIGTAMLTISIISSVARQGLFDIFSFGIKRAFSIISEPNFIKYNESKVKNNSVLIPRYIISIILIVISFILNT